MTATAKILTDPDEEWLYAIGAALMGFSVGAHDNGKIVEGSEKPALTVVFMTARCMPDHLMRTLGDLLFSEDGRNLLPEPLRPVEPQDLILWVIRLAALFGLAGSSEMTRTRRLPMEQRLSLGDVQHAATKLVDELVKIHTDLPGAFEAAFANQGESIPYEEIMRSLRRLANRHVATA